MSNSLYEEAINAAEQIKEAAENKVKQQLIESMSPQIKQLVEKALHDKTDGSQNKEVNEEETTEECGTYESEELQEETLEKVDLDKPDGIPQELGGEIVSSPPDDSFFDTDLINEPVEEPALDVEDKLGKQISNESINIFKKLITKNAQKNALKKKLRHIREGITSLKKVMLLSENNHISRKNAKKIVETYKNLCQELKNIKTNSIIKSDTKLLKEYLEISKELNNMSRRQSKKYLNESLDDLLEMHLFEEDEADAVEADPEADAVEADPEADPVTTVDTDGVSDALEDLFKALGADESLNIDVTQSGEGSGDLEGEESDDLEGEESDDDDDDILSDLETESNQKDESAIYELDETYLEMDNVSELEEMIEIEEMDNVSELEEMIEIEEMDKMEGMEEIETCADGSKEEGEHIEESSRRKGELFLEIDENMLKREISKMKRARGNLSVDNVQSNKLDEMKIKAVLTKAAKKNRMLESKLSQYKKAVRQMKGQLSEMNLFNAKLLYANKLMQNRDLSVKQQRKIVESLDNAKTLNEAKLLFESLSGSLTNSNANRKSGSKLTEGSNRRLIGSSSRSTSSAQSLNESVALDRWATLAGIKK